MKKPEQLYLFFRGEYFYPITLRDDEDAIQNARYNLETTKVIDQNGRIVFESN